MRKQWPAKRQRVRLGAQTIKQVPKPKKSQKSLISEGLETKSQSKAKKKKEKKPKVELEEKSEEVKEEQLQAEVSAETAEEPEESEVSEESTEEERVEGTVKFFNPNKGFGFITGDDGKEYYVHENALREGVSIAEGDKVSFKAVEGDKGPKAEDVEKKEVV